MIRLIFLLQQEENYKMKKTLLALSVIAATSVQAEHHKKVELSDIDKCYMNAVEKYPGMCCQWNLKLRKIA
jgi:nucleoside-specific outer membrane channel protein Tsx